MKKKRIMQRMIVSTISVGIIAVLGVSSAFADSSIGSVDKVKLTIPSSCTLMSKVDSDHSFVTFGGTYKEDIGNTTVKIICNDSNGFAVYSIGSSNNENGNTNLVNNINRSNDIATGIATSGDISNWSMKTTKMDGNYPLTMNPDYDGLYTAVPSEWTKIAHRDSSTDVAADTVPEGSSFTTTYAAYITPAQPAGTYEGRVKYVMLHPSTAPAPVGIEGIVYMQEFANLSPAEKASLKDTMIEDQQYVLKDSRDEKEYYVAKLADGNIWMTQNLDFDLSDSNILTLDDTDLTGNWRPSLSTYKTENLWYYSVDMQSYDPGDICWNGIVNTAWNGTIHDAVSCNGRDKHFSIGNYYSYAAAIAQDNLNAPSDDTGQSICPSGWHLPNSDDYGNLSDALSLSAGVHGSVMSDPVYFVYGGYWYGPNNNFKFDFGTSARYATSSSLDPTHFKTFLASASGAINPNYSVDKHFGYSVRCLAK